MKNFEREQIEISKDFECPVTLQPMFDPVVAQDGETYEREAIQEVINQAKQQKKKLLSPIHHVEMGDELIPNRRMASNIKEFLTQHPQCIENFYFPKSSITECLTALKSDQLEVLRRLLDKDKRLLYKELEGKKTLIDLACEFGSEPTLALVIAQLKKINKFTYSKEKQEELLQLFVKTKNLNGIEKFIAESQWTQADKKTFFIKQIEKGSVALIEIFLGELIAIDAWLDENHNNPLHVAVIYNQKTVIDLLMTLGINSKLTNKQLKRPEHLAAELGNQGLAAYISQRRQEIKLGPLKAQMEKLTKENADLKKDRDNFENQFRQLQSDFQELEIKTNTKPAFFTPKRLQKQEPTDEFNRLQKDFINEILAGNLEKAIELHKKGASLTKAIVTKEYVDDDSKKPSIEDSGWWSSSFRQQRQQMLVKNYPLIAAVHSGDKAVLTYIENALGAEAKQYWLLMDENKIQQKFDAMIPQERPTNATVEWLGKWYKQNANCPWKKDYDASISPSSEKEKSIDWENKGDAMMFGYSWEGGRKRLPIKCYKWEQTLTVCLTVCIDGWGRYSYIAPDPKKHDDFVQKIKEYIYIAPDPKKHDEFVQKIIDQMQMVKENILKKITEAKSQPVWRPLGSK